MTVAVQRADSSDRAAMRSKTTKSGRARVKGIGGNSHRGRRLDDIAEELARLQGGWANLTPLQLMDIRKAALLGLQSEETIEARLRDPSTTSLEDVTRAEMLADRARRRLRVAPNQTKPSQSLADYVASKRQSPPSAPAAVDKGRLAPTVPGLAGEPAAANGEGT